MCHIPEQGFTHREMATSVGIEGRTVRRNAPTLYNVAYFKTLFHDGRETNLEQQVWGPLLAHNEMGNPSIGFVIEKIKHNPDYQNLFEQAFAEPVNMQNIGMALASYQRSLNSANSAFDQWYYLKQKTALTLSAERGFDLFIGKAGCVNCHHINQEFALFTDQQFHNTGIGYDQSINKTTEQFKLQIAPGVFINVDSKTIRSISENKPADLGVYEISQNPQDRWKYKTPSLRNIALTAPYMHNGQFSTLEQVLAFYNQGGIKNSMLDPLLKPLGLTQIEIKDLIAFLNSLTGTNVEELVSDAFAAPIGD
jgi:cytochrome c peroxidase